MAIFNRGWREGILARLYRKLLHSFYVNDLWLDLRLHAKQEAVQYIIQKMPEAMVRRDRYDLLNFALSRAPAEGLILEFGVEKGLSLRHLAGQTSRLVHGFDSFEGLPGDWTGTKEAKGAFSRGRKAPKIMPNNRLHIGWFDATLPQFLRENPEPCALIHIDCDIYESTRTVLRLLRERIQSGTVIVFDEYFNYPGWRGHEFKAFGEFIAKTNIGYEYLAYAGEKGHVAVVIT